MRMGRALKAGCGQTFPLNSLSVKKQLFFPLSRGIYRITGSLYFRSSVEIYQIRIIQMDNYMACIVLQAVKKEETYSPLRSGI